MRERLLWENFWSQIQISCPTILRLFFSFLLTYTHNISIQAGEESCACFLLLTLACQKSTGAKNSKITMKTKEFQNGKYLEQGWMAEWGGNKRPREEGGGDVPAPLADFSCSNHKNITVFVLSSWLQTTPQKMVSRNLPHLVLPTYTGVVYVTKEINSTYV